MAGEDNDPLLFQSYFSYRMPRLRFTAVCVFIVERKFSRKYQHVLGNHPDAFYVRFFIAAF
jgi:hypothetical protein